MYVCMYVCVSTRVCVSVCAHTQYMLLKQND
jgi:hypothetical protein